MESLFSKNNRNASPFLPRESTSQKCRQTLSDGRTPSRTDFKLALKSHCTKKREDHILLTLSNARSLASSHLTDVTFLVGEFRSHVKAHKLILALTSPVFYAMFYGSLPETDEIEVPDSIEKSFGILLVFLYTNQFLMEDDDLTLSEAINVLHNARKYDVPQLETRISHYIQDSIVLENVSDVLEAAILYEREELQNQCWTYLEYHADAFFHTDNFLSLPRSTLELVLKRDCLSVNEATLFRAVERWAESACIRGGLDHSPSNRRGTLGDLIYLVRFPIMRATEFSDGPVRSGMLTDTEINCIFTYICSSSDKPAVPFECKARRWRNPEIYSECLCYDGKNRNCKYCFSVTKEDNASKIISSSALLSSPTPPSYCACRTRSFCPSKRQW